MKPLQKELEDLRESCGSYFHAVVPNKETGRWIAIARVKDNTLVSLKETGATEMEATTLLRDFVKTL